MTMQSLSIVVLSTDLDNLNEIRAALAADSRAQLLSGGNDAEQLYEEVVRLKPSAAIISIGSKSDQAIKLIQRLNAECPGTAVISVARETSSDLILQSLRSGAKEFLRSPISTDELKTVLDRISKSCSGQTETAKKIGRMTSVFSCKGGCGTSFIAINLAASSTVPTVLVDLNFESGDLPLFLNLNPKYSVADMVARQGDLDDGMISIFTTPYSTNLHLLAAPKELDPIEKIEPEHVFEVLQRLRECYDHVVLDLQHTFDAITLMALDQSDEIVLVLTLDILAIRSAIRALQIFERVGYSRTKVRIAVNRRSKQIDLDLSKVEQLLGKPVNFSLPSDYQTVVDSINRGIPLVKSNSMSKIGREIKHIAQALSLETTQVEKPKYKRFWSFFQNHQPVKEDF
jgi:pilus assembly protein CpaE